MRVALGKLKGSQVFHVPVRPLPSKRWNLLLGHDFLTNHGCKVDFRTGQISFQSEEKTESADQTAQKIVEAVQKLVAAEKPTVQADVSGPVTQNDEGDDPNTVYACLVRKAVIPPNGSSEVQVRLRGGNIKRGTRCVLEPNERKKIKGLILPETVLHVGKKGLCCTRIINNTDQDLHVNKNMHLYIVKPYVDALEEELYLDTDRDVPHEPVQLKDFDLEHLRGQERKELENLLTEFNSIFASHSYDFEGVPPEIITHKFHLRPGAELPKQKYYSIPVHLKPQVEKELQAMLKAGIIEPSTSERFCSPLLAVPKPNGIRLCVDMKAVNKICEVPTGPVPNLFETIQSVNPKAAVYSLLDLCSGYLQLEIEQEHRELTTFRYENQLFQFRKMPFGTSNAPAVFNRFVGSLFAHLNPDVKTFFDDILLATPCWRTNIGNLRKVFQILKDNRLKLKPRKCSFLKPSQDFVGVTLIAGGYKPSEKQVQAIKNLKIPESAKALRRYLGTCGFLRSFCPDFSGITSPLTQLLRKGQKFRWTSECQEAFTKLQSILCQAPVLALPKIGERFHLYTDASQVSVSGVLFQDFDGIRHPLGYFSRKLSDQERRYCTTERELLSIVNCLSRWRKLLMAAPISIHTDHGSLRWLMTMQTPNAKLSRWKLLISQFVDSRFEIHHVAGKSNQFADLLSRDVQVIETEGNRSTNMEEVNDREGTGEPGDTSEKEEKEALAKQQYLDAELGPIIDKLKNGSTAEIAELTDRFALMEGVLYYVAVDNRKGIGQRDLARVCVPTTLKAKILAQAHDNISTGGHFGIQSTYTKLCKSYFWKSMFADTVNYVKSCKLCLEYHGFRAGSKLPLHPWKVIGHPFHTVSVDCMTLPPSENGFSYVLLIVCQFSKYIELAPLRTLTGNETAEALVNYLYCRHGAPVKLVSDLGTNFCSSIVKSLNETFQISSVFTSPAHAASNGTAERHVAMTKTTLSTLAARKPSQWPRYLQVTAWLLNNLCRTSSHYTPHFICTGRDARLPGQLIQSPIQWSYNETPNYVQDIVTRLQEVYREVKKHLDRAAETRVERREKIAKDRKLEVGDLVFVRGFRPGTHASRALAQKNSGPYRILSQVGKVHFKIAPLEAPHKVQTLHSERLIAAPLRKPFLTLEREAGEPSEDRAEPSMEVKDGSRKDSSTQPHSVREQRPASHGYNLRRRRNQLPESVFLAGDAQCTWE